MLTGGIFILATRKNPTQLAINLALRIYAKLTIIMDIRVKGLNICLVGRMVGEIVHVAVKLNLIIVLKLQFIY